MIDKGGSTSIFLLYLRDDGQAKVNGSPWHVFPWAFSWSSQTCCGWLSWFLFFTWSQGTPETMGHSRKLEMIVTFFFFWGGGPGLHYSSLKNKLSWLENEHGLKMYFLLNVRIFQPGILDYQKEGTSAISISGYCSYAMLCHWQTSGHEIVRTAELLVGALDLCIPFLSICLFYAYCILGWYGMCHKDIKCLDVSRRYHEGIVKMPSTLYAFSCLNVSRRYHVLMDDQTWR